MVNHAVPTPAVELEPVPDATVAGAEVDVGVRLRGAAGLVATRWRWEHGPPSTIATTDLDAHLTGRHRFDQPGIYRISVDALDEDERRVMPTAWRYHVVVDTVASIAGSGIIVPDGSAVAGTRFGLLLCGPDESNPELVRLRWELPDGEAITDDLGWFSADASGWIHFGGMARPLPSTQAHPYRVDAELTGTDTDQPTRLTISLYRPMHRPGLDSPWQRFSGEVHGGTIRRLGGEPPSGR